MSLRYPTAAAGADIARALAGFAVTAGPALLVPLAWPAMLALGAGAALFAVFGVRAIGRVRLELTLDEDGLGVAAGAPRIAWSEIEHLSLAYYSVRRDAERGWFELVARGAGGTVRVDSRLEGFDDLVRAAARAAQRRGLVLDAATRENLAFLTGTRGTGIPGV